MRLAILLLVFTLAACGSAEKPMPDVDLKEGGGGGGSAATPEVIHEQGKVGGVIKSPPKAVAPNMVEPRPYPMTTPPPKIVVTPDERQYQKSLSKSEPKYRIEPSGGSKPQELYYSKTEPMAQGAPRPIPLEPPTAEYHFDKKKSIKDIQNKMIIPEPKPNIDNVIDEVMGQLSSASMAFNMPETANIQDTVRAQLLISPEVTSEDLAKQLNVPGKTIHDPIIVASVMEAQLSSADLTIYKLTPSEQTIIGPSPAEWLWEIGKPLPVGKHSLTLSIDAVIMINDIITKKHIRTFTKDLSITITNEQRVNSWLEKHGQWIWTSTLVPLLIWIWNKHLKYFWRNSRFFKKQS